MHAYSEAATARVARIVLTTNKSVFKALPYNPETDFVAMTKLVNQGLVRVVNDKAKYGTVASILSAAKANPGKLTYACSGDGSPHHLAGLMFEGKTGVKLLHVPYKGGAPAITDLMGGCGRYGILAAARGAAIHQGGQASCGRSTK